MPFHSDTIGLMAGSSGRPGQLGPVGVLQHVHHVRAADAFRVVQARAWKPRSFSSPTRLVAVATMSSLVPKPIARWAGLHARRLQAHPTRSEHSVHL